MNDIKSCGLGTWNIGVAIHSDGEGTRNSNSGGSR